MRITRRCAGAVRHVCGVSATGARAKLSLCGARMRCWARCWARAWARAWSPDGELSRSVDEQ